MLLKSYPFCPKCGNKISQVGTISSVISRAATTTSTSASSASFPATISNFETLRERTETERRSFSVRKKSGSKKQRIQDIEVCTTVGLIKKRKIFMRIPFGLQGWIFFSPSNIPHESFLMDMLVKRHPL